MFSFLKCFAVIDQQSTTVVNNNYNYLNLNANRREKYDKVSQNNSVGIVFHEE